MRGGGSISYEVDLWGKNRNHRLSRPTIELDASQFDRDALRLVVTSDVTDFYSQVLSLNDRIRIAEFNLKNAEEILRIIEARFAQGGVSGLEVSQQRVAVNGFRTALTALVEAAQHYGQCAGDSARQSAAKFVYACGRARIVKNAASQSHATGNLVDRAARYSKRRGRLARANADIGVARAAFFPSLTLGVDTAVAAGFGGPASAATSLASSLLAPIFTGGALTGNLENVTARQKELAAQYQKTVLVAFQEVEDALAALKSNNEQAAISVESVKESQNAYDIAKARFDAGAIDYLNLLETQRSLYLQQDSQIAIRQGQLQSFVQLRKALGA